MASPLAAREFQPFLPLVSFGAAVGVVEQVGAFMLRAMALGLEARGASLGVIGAQAAMVGLGLMLSALLVPWLQCLVRAERDLAQSARPCQSKLA